MGSRNCTSPKRQRPSRQDGRARPTSSGSLSKVMAKYTKRIGLIVYCAMRSDPIRSVQIRSILAAPLTHRARSLECRAFRPIGSDRIDLCPHTPRCVQSGSRGPGCMLHRRITLRTVIEQGAVQRVGVQVSPHLIHRCRIIDT